MEKITKDNIAFPEKSGTKKNESGSRLLFFLHLPSPMMEMPPELPDGKDHAENESGDMRDERYPAMSGRADRGGAGERAGTHLDEEPQPKDKERRYWNYPYENDENDQCIDFRCGEPEEISAQHPGDRPRSSDQGYV